ncbi:hypothetical protein NFI96_020455, partial [Prochilodus magdalenae]
VLHQADTVAQQKTGAMLFHCAFTLLCLALTVDRMLVESARLLWGPDVDGSRIASDLRQAPGRYSVPDFARWFMASKEDKLVNAPPLGEHSSDEKDIMKRQEEFLFLDAKPDEKKRKPGCRNYYWKSWTAC